MSPPRRSPETLRETLALVQKHGTVVAAAKALGIPSATMQHRYEAALAAKKEKAVIEMSPLRRHLIIPDTQVRPGVPTDHIGWIAKAIVEYRPDVIVHLGDHWDMASLNKHEMPGSMNLEGKRYQDDIKAGNDAFFQLCAPMNAEADYKPRKIFLLGNHEDRADRAAASDPKWFGHVGSENCNTLDWERHKFLERVEVDGVLYSHYFQNTHSSRPIGGEVSNRLTRIGCSFVQGHEQGRKLGERIMASRETWSGIVAGSCYLHVEDYRGAQGQRHWRGIIILNEVENGEFDIMSLSLRYLCRKYENTDLYDYMVRKYSYGDWVHLK